jgi:hypothetical protein
MSETTIKRTMKDKILTALRKASAMSEGAVYAEVCDGNNGQMRNAQETLHMLVESGRVESHGSYINGCYTRVVSI